MTIESESNEKLKQFIHYVIFRTSEIKNVGKTVLYKILYFTDFNYYELHEQLLSGETYQKLPKGPAPRNFDNIVGELGVLIDKTTIDHYGYTLTKYKSKVPPNLTEFTKEQIEFIDRNIERYSKYNATDISDISHNDVPYIAAKDYGILDYECVFYRSAEFSVRKYDEDEEENECRSSPLIFPT